MAWTVDWVSEIDDQRPSEGKMVHVFPLLELVWHKACPSPGKKCFQGWNAFLHVMIGVIFELEVLLRVVVSAKMRQEKWAL